MNVQSPVLLGKCFTEMAFSLQYMGLVWSLEKVNKLQILREFASQSADSIPILQYVIVAAPHFLCLRFLIAPMHDT
jgi:hypothetical protein